MTCESCLTDARELLAGIVTLWLELPVHLAQLRGSLNSGGSRGAADGRPLLGGDVLVLLGAGSPGYAEDEKTTRDGDPPSVAYELGWWEADWRERRGDLPAEPVRLAKALRRSAGYLEVHARWAAREHPGFADFHQDLSRLHELLERATGRARAAAHANAACFDCGGQLVRPLVEQLVVQWWLPHAVGPVREQDVRFATGPMEVEDDRDQSPIVECRVCRRRYTPAEYALALRATSDSGLQGWVTVADAAAGARRSVETLESWVKRGLLEVACRVRDRRHLVWWPDVEARTRRARRRSQAS